MRKDYDSINGYKRLLSVFSGMPNPSREYDDYLITKHPTILYP